MTSKVWHGGDKTSRAKRTSDVVRRCHHWLVLHFSFLRSIQLFLQDSDSLVCQIHML